jgi:hypothetical protein
MDRKNSMVARLFSWRRLAEGDEGGIRRRLLIAAEFLGQEMDLVAAFLRGLVLDVVVLVKLLIVPGGAAIDFVPVGQGRQVVGHLDGRRNRMRPRSLGRAARSRETAWYAAGCRRWKSAM